MNPAEVLARRVARSASEATYVNTINVNDRVTIDLVWYPGADNLADSIVDPIIEDAPDGSKRWIHYTWQREGKAAITRKVNTSRITLVLPPGGSGTLTCLDTSWRITRAAAGVTMDPANTLSGIQQRLDRLGYHVRAPGARNAGIDNRLGPITEEAILRFQADYRPQPGAPAAAVNRLQVRGEWTANASPTYAADLQQYNGGAAVVPNPSVTDSQALQAALVTKVGV